MPNIDERARRILGELESGGEEAQRELKEWAAKAPAEVEGALRALVSRPLAAVPFAGVAAAAGVPFEKRQSWWTDERVRRVQPLRLYRPSRLEDLVHIVQAAEAHGVHARAYGAAQSYSDVATCPDFLVDMRELDDPLPVDPTQLRSPAGASHLFAFEAGMRVRELNEHLWGRGRALAQMGGYDAMTFVGAVMTGTHGSGIDLGPLASQLRSIVIVVGGGRVLRIEPQGGITNPATHDEPGIELRQDDDLFRSVAVSMGCMGLIHAVTIQVLDAYHLHEVRTLHKWSQIRPQLEAGIQHAHRHVEVYVNPNKTNGDHTALLTVRDPHGGPPARGSAGRRNFLPTMMESLPIASELLLGVLDKFPKLAPKLVDRALGGLVDDAYVERSYRVLADAVAPHGFATEIAFSTKDGRYLDAVQAMFDIAEKHAEMGARFMNILSLRFVAASDAYLSPQHDEAGVPTCMVELPTLSEWVGAREGYAAVQRAMLTYGGRPHWGLEFCTMSGAELLTAMYPRLAEFLGARAELDPAGTFDNAFTDRTGLSRPMFAR